MNKMKNFLMKTGVYLLAFALIYIILDWLVYFKHLGPAKEPYPCDHGPECGISHCPGMFCEYHQMYHHRDLPCKNTGFKLELEKKYINQREKELKLK